MNLRSAPPFFQVIKKKLWKKQFPPCLRPLSQEPSARRVPLQCIGRVQPECWLEVWWLEQPILKNHHILVGGFNPIWKIWVQLDHETPGRGENKKNDWNQSPSHIPPNVLKDFGQIGIIFHQPRFLNRNKGISRTKPLFGVRLCEVALIWPERLEQQFYSPKLQHSWLEDDFPFGKAQFQGLYWF